jgi:hypothetical protein
VEIVFADCVEGRTRGGEKKKARQRRAFFQRKITCLTKGGEPSSDEQRDRRLNDRDNTAGGLDSTDIHPICQKVQ